MRDQNVNNSNRTSNLHAVKRILVIGVLVLLTVAGARAQSATDGSTPAGLSPGSPAGSYAISGFENVNLYGGGLDVHVPVYSIGGRGAAGSTIAVAVNPNPWLMKGTGVWHDWWTTLLPGYGPGVLQGRRSGMAYQSPNICSSDHLLHYRWTRTTLTFTTSDGTEYELRDQQSGGKWTDAGTNYCSNSPSRGTVFVTADGSFATFISDTAIVDNQRYGTGGQTSVLTTPSGYLILKDGTRYRIVGGLVAWIRDRNGNLTSYAYGANSGDTYSYRKLISATDPLGRTTTISYTAAADTITFPGFGGSTQSVVVHHIGLNAVLRADFLSQGGCQDTGGPYYAGLKRPSDLFPGVTPWVNETCFNVPLVSSIVLPDGRSYNFKYNPYGEVARIESPTGGAIEYDMTGGVVYGDVEQGTTISRRVAERRVYTSTSDTTPISKMTYSHDLDDGSGRYEIDAVVIVDQMDPQNEGQILTRSKHYFKGNPIGPMLYTSNLTPAPYPAFNEGRETKTENFSVSGGAIGSVLQRSITTWEAGAAIATGAPAANARVSEMIMELADTGLTSRQTFAYDGYNNLTEFKEYGFGSGAPGTTLLRRTATSYVTVLNGFNYDTDTAIHLRSLPAQKLVFDGSGNLKSRSDFEYDNYSSDARHSPLVARSSVNSICVVYDQTANCDASPQNTVARGNLTGTTNYANAAAGTGPTKGSIEYDVTGNGVGTVDGNGNTVQVAYSGDYQYAFPTATTSSIPDLNNTYGSGTAFTSSTAYDIATGVVTSLTDANGLTTTIAYNDALSRPTLVTRPAGGGWTSFIYGDAPGNVFVKTTTALDAGHSVDAYQYFDGLGRKTRSFTADGSAWTGVEVQYDALSRPYRSTNPYNASTLNSGAAAPQWTTKIFDSLGRVISVETPRETGMSSGAKVLTSYSGNRVLVTDQAGTQRISESNALGQLTDVFEVRSVDSGSGTVSVSFPGHSEISAGYRTSYVYETLGNLVTAAQGGQSRTFSYDSLARLISATNPESGTTTYEYDANGNLIKKTDARGIQIHNFYDGLNRVFRRQYVAPNPAPANYSATPDVYYYYDGRGVNGSVANGIGHLTKVDNTFSITQFTGFDAMGRVLASEQTTAGLQVCGGSSPACRMSYRYNLVGTLIEETYPSGRIVRQTYGADGKLTSVASRVAMNRTFKSYAQNFSYDAAGTVTGVQLGNMRWESTVFNNRLQPTQIALGSAPGAADILKLQYTYGTTENNGNMIGQTITVPSAGATPGFIATQTYTYDELKRLHSATEVSAPNGGSNIQSWKQTYRYDRFGNRTFDTANGATTTLPQNYDSNVNNPAINQVNNRFGEGQNYAYDAAGNITADATGNQFEYDGENMQTRAVIGTSGDGATYLYDGDGNRVKKTVGTEITVFVYNASGKMIAEYSVFPPATPQVAYLTADNLGTPRINTDASGAVAARHDYMPFGSLIGLTGNRSSQLGYVGDSVRNGFTQYESDSESGLEFAQTRYYSAALGRFNSPDDFVNDTELVDPASWNLYIYVRNNPLRFSDPSGEKVYVGFLTQVEQDQAKADLNSYYGCASCVDIDAEGFLTVDTSSLSAAVAAATQDLTDAIQSKSKFIAIVSESSFTGDKQKNFRNAVSFAAETPYNQSVKFQGQIYAANVVFVDFSDRKQVQGPADAVKEFLITIIPHELLHAYKGSAADDPTGRNGITETGPTVDNTNAVALARDGQNAIIRYTYFVEAGEFQANIWFGNPVYKNGAPKRHGNGRLEHHNDKYVHWNMRLVGNGAN